MEHGLGNVDNIHRQANNAGLNPLDVEKEMLAMSGLHILQHHANKEDMEVFRKRADELLEIIHKFFDEGNCAFTAMSILGYVVAAIAVELKVTDAKKEWDKEHKN